VDCYRLLNRNVGLRVWNLGIAGHTCVRCRFQEVTVSPREPADARASFIEGFEVENTPAIGERVSEVRGLQGSVDRPLALPRQSIRPGNQNFKTPFTPSVQNSKIPLTPSVRVRLESQRISQAES
jgi:hypothetical protein